MSARLDSILRRITCTAGVTLLLSFTAAVASAEQWSMGYYTPWGNTTLPISSVNWGALSHGIYGFAIVKSDGSLDLNSLSLAQNAQQFVAAAHTAGVKATFSLAEAWWNGDTTSFQQAATNNRATLVNNVMNVVNTYGFDGVDVDWEPLSISSQGTALQSLAADLRTRLGTTRILTIAVGFFQSDYTYWAKAQTYFDRISVMTYDMTGSWDPYAWHNAALYDSDGRVWSVNRAIEKFRTGGVDLAKVNIGIPFYGYVWRGASGPRQSTNGTSSTQTSYQSLVSSYHLKSASWDDVAKVPYLSNPFVSFDNEQSVAAKVNYATSRGLGGWIVWELSADYLPGQNPSNPLAAALKSAWRGTTTTTAPAAPTNVRITR